MTASLRSLTDNARCRAQMPWNEWKTFVKLIMQPHAAAVQAQPQITHALAFGPASELTANFMLI